jgi:AcrR family transcriptional regulator
METVTRLFYEQGFQATGINQIIEESEVAKASLYEHFPSKEAILQAYLEEATEQWRSEFGEFSKGKTPGEKTILALFDFRKQLAVKRGFKGCTFIRVVYELPNLDEGSLTAVRRYKEYVRNMLRTNIALLPGKRSPKEAEDLVEMIITLYEGCGVQSSLERGARPIDSARSIAQKLLQ